MRQSDLVGRFGGEEMAVVLSGTESAELRQAAERVRRVVQDASFTHEGTPLRVTVSVGAAECLHQESADELVGRADEALYFAKQAGRNCACWHSGSHCQLISEGVRLTDKTAEVAPETPPVEGKPSRSTESFAEVCQQLRHRLEEVTTGADDEGPGNLPLG
jgi:predicted signal transduction protein with EAL and GGDEF domain